jgi:hypothetical protein
MYLTSSHSGEQACDTNSCLVMAKVRDTLAVSKHSTNTFHTERYNRERG